MSVEAILMHFETMFAFEIRLIVQAFYVAVFKCVSYANNYFDLSIGLIRRWHQNYKLQKATINSDTDIFSLDLSCQTNLAEI